VRVLFYVLIFAALAGCQGEQHAGEVRSAEAAPGAGSTEAGHAAAEPAVVVDLSPRKPVIEETIAYGEADDHNLNGVLTLPADSFEPPPGVLIIHEWWGLNETLRTLARRLAGEGFVVLAIDLYGGEVAASTAQAQALMTRVMTDPEAALDNIRQGIEYLRRYALAPRVATIGWSFGGTWSLQAGLRHADLLDAVVMYYGQLVSDEAQIEQLDSPILGMFAGNDESITPDSVVGFRAALRQAGKNADVRIYPDTGHEFATPDSDNYDAAAAEDAWSRTIAFLDMHLR
jgi:carboxymethylenebutenolidase